MVAADTNVLVRLLTGDHPQQASWAEAVFPAQQVWVAKTVLLETEWVLRALYEFTAEEVAGALRRLGGLQNVQLEAAAAAAQALDWQKQGLDFADALHPASRGPAQAFASFDRELIKKARRAGVGGVGLACVKGSSEIFPGTIIQTDPRRPVLADLLEMERRMPGGRAFSSA